MRNGRISANTRLNRQGNWASWHVFISKQPQCYTDGGKEWTVQALTSKALPRDVMSLTIHDPPNPLYSASIFFSDFRWLTVSVDCKRGRRCGRTQRTYQRIQAHRTVTP